MKNYETRDITARPMLVTALVTILLAAVMFFLLAQSIKMEKHHAPSEAPATRNGISKYEDYARFKAREDQILGSYGWVDRAHQKVRIPIERAMEIDLERRRR